MSDEANINLPEKYLPVFGSIERDIPAKAGYHRPALKKLSPIHKRMVAMHLSGIPITEISNLTDYSYSMVRAVLHDPIAQEIITQFHEQVNDEFLSLGTKANDAVRDGLNHDSMGQRLRAAKMYFDRADGMGDKSEETAEDVVQRILAQVNVQVNINASGGD